MKHNIDVIEHSGEIMKAMQRGILLTTRSGDRVNTMTIGWGHIGIEWGKTIFVAYVRESRYTKQFLDANGEFTVNIPKGEFDSKILGFCGTKSGRDVDKIRELDLHLEEPVCVSVPGIKELPLTLECKVLYQQEQDLSAVPANILEKYYPADGNGHRDGHTVYYGEILASYLITE